MEGMDILRKNKHCLEGFKSGSLAKNCASIKKHFYSKGNNSSALRESKNANPKKGNLHNDNAESKFKDEKND